jgi:hypothetical protein
MFRPDGIWMNSNEELVGAIFAGDVEAVFDLLAAGADANARTERAPEAPPRFGRAWATERPAWWTAPILVLAVVLGNTEIVDLLLDAGAKVDARTTVGSCSPISDHEYEYDDATALIVASAMGKVDMVELLIKRGANPDVLDDSSRTALHLAASRGHEQIVYRLISSGADPNLGRQSGKLKSLLAKTR